MQSYRFLNNLLLTSNKIYDIVNPLFFERITTMKVYTLNSNVNISIQRGEQVQISSGLYCRTQKSVYL